MNWQELEKQKQEEYEKLMSYAKTNRSIGLESTRYVILAIGILFGFLCYYVSNNCETQVVKGSFLGIKMTEPTIWLYVQLFSGVLCFVFLVYALFYNPKTSQDKANEQEAEALRIKNMSLDEYASELRKRKLIKIGKSIIKKGLSSFEE